MKIHFIGIGGIGVSALAKYYLEKGHQITGSDLVDTELTQALKKRGARISIGPHHAENIPFQVNTIIYSPAVQRDNPELQHAKVMRSRVSSAARVDLQATLSAATKIEVLSYPAALGKLTKQYYTIAVSGTHGKSTTTAMLAKILLLAEFDPTVIIGTKMKELDPKEPSGSNCRVGKDKHHRAGKPILLIEADEHFASFLNYSPSMIVLTTIEPDHIDYYKNLDNIIRAFHTYVSNLPKDGIIIANKDDQNTKKAVKSSKHPIQYYSAKWNATKKLREILKVPGEFNVANAHAALTAARALDITDKISFQALAEFEGTWRRFEIFSFEKPIPYTLVSDYGHHPTEVKVTVEAAREKWPKKKIWLVFQPHQYLRTYHFWRDFIRILSQLPVEKLILLDIYDVAGREDKEAKSKVSTEKLVKEIQRRASLDKPEHTVLYLPSMKEAEAYIKTNLQQNQILMVMGAGDIYDLTVRLTHPQQKRKIKQ